MVTDKNNSSGRSKILKWLEKKEKKKFCNSNRKEISLVIFFLSHSYILNQIMSLVFICVNIYPYKPCVIAWFSTYTCCKTFLFSSSRYSIRFTAKCKTKWQMKITKIGRHYPVEALVFNFNLILQNESSWFKYYKEVN
jgi:hypothetical protein